MGTDDCRFSAFLLFVLFSCVLAPFSGRLYSSETMGTFQQHQQIASKTLSRERMSLSQEVQKKSWVGVGVLSVDHLGL